VACVGLIPRRLVHMAVDRLSGMNEAKTTIELSEAARPAVSERILQLANVGTVTCDMVGGKYRFSSQTLLSNEALIVSLDVDAESGKATCRVNSDNAVLASNILALLKKALRE